MHSLLFNNNEVLSGALEEPTKVPHEQYLGIITQRALTENYKVSSQMRLSSLLTSPSFLNPSRARSYMVNPGRREELLRWGSNIAADPSSNSSRASWWTHLYSSKSTTSEILLF